MGLWSCTPAPKTFPPTPATAVSAPTSTPPSLELPTRTPPPAPLAEATVTAAANAAPQVTETAVPTKPLTNTVTPAVIGLSFERAALVNDILPGSVEDLSASRDGTLWLVTSEGISRKAGGSTVWSTFLADGPQDRNFVGMDEAGNAWFASPDGVSISVYDGNTWKNFGEAEGWKTPATPFTPAVLKGVARDASGSTWVHTVVDVRVFDGSTWKIFLPPDMGMNKQMSQFPPLFFTLTAAANGSVVWNGECSWDEGGPRDGLGVRWFQNGEWLGTDSPVGYGCTLALREAPDGRIWIGLNDHLWRYNPANGEWFRFVSPPYNFEGAKGNFIGDITLAPDGSVWATYQLCREYFCDVRVLAHLVNERWQEVMEITPGSHLLFDGKGRGWLLSATNGISEMVNGQFQKPAALYPQMSVVDSAGEIWFVTTRGGKEELWKIVKKQ